MKLTVNTFLTLDGVMQAPGGPEEDRSGGFEHGGWVMPYFDEMMGQVIDASNERLDALLLGRKTYEIFAAHWPFIGDEDPIAARFNRVPKHVASRTLHDPQWHGTTVIEGDVADGVARLKQQSGRELQVHGSGDLIQTLLRHGLVDEFRLWMFPVVLGTGKRLFVEGTAPAGLALVDSKTSTTGVAIHTYRAGGKPDYGSFALDQPSPAEVERRRAIDEAERNDGGRR